MGLYPAIDYRIVHLYLFRSSPIDVSHLRGLYMRPGWWVQIPAHLSLNEDLITPITPSEQGCEMLIGEYT